MVLPVTGVSLGVVQVVRGVLAQPAAISGYLRGHVWDEVGANPLLQPVAVLCESWQRLSTGLGCPVNSSARAGRGPPHQSLRAPTLLPPWRCSSRW